MNNSRPTPILALLIALLVSPLALAECDYDDFPEMPDMLLGSIGSNMQWNNAPMAGRSFRVAASPDAVRQFYNEAWKELIDVSEFNGWQQILHINEDCMMMVRVKPQNSTFSYGQLMLVNPPDKEIAARELGSGLPVPSEAVVVSDMRSEDAYRNGHLLLLLSDSNLHESTLWYETELRRQGWQLEQRSTQGDSTVLNFARGKEMISVGLARAKDKTQILINRMDH